MNCIAIQVLAPHCLLADQYSLSLSLPVFFFSHQVMVSFGKHPRIQLKCVKHKLTHIHAHILPLGCNLYNMLKTHHLKCFQQFPELMRVLLLIIYSIKHYVFNKDLLLATKKADKISQQLAKATKLVIMDIKDNLCAFIYATLSILERSKNE